MKPFKVCLAPAWRVYAMALMLAACFMAIGWRLVKLQIWDPSREASHGLTKVLVTSRGKIFDARDNLLAVNLPAKNYFIDPSTILKEHKPILPVVAGRLADVLGLPADEILAKLRHPASQYQWLGTFVEREAFLVLTNTALFSGIHDDPKKPGYIRLYPQGARMAHVIGFLSREHGEPRGALGVEKHLDGELRGEPGSYECQYYGPDVDNYGTRENYKPPKPGADVYLTLDNNIQALLEAGLGEAREKWSASAAWGVIQDVRTGAILAMASMPGFDPNQPGADSWRDEAPSQKNCPLYETYEPGSTMKTFTIAIALDEKIITPASTVFVEGGGVWRYKGSKLSDPSTVLHGKQVGLPLIIQKSSNIASAKIGLMLADNTRSIRNGAHRRHEMCLRLFGFGRETGIDLPGEKKGVLHPAEKWDALTATRVAIGHSVNVTAIQMVTAYSAIANGGLLMKPYVVRRVVKENGEVCEAKPEVVARPVSAKTSAIMRGLLVGVTQKGGTAPMPSIRDAGYTVAGKTGTTKMAVPGGYSETDYIASFAGFCPSENPVFSMIIVVEKPRGHYHGGDVAAPVFESVAINVARYLCVPSDIDGEVVESLIPFQFDPAPAMEDAEYWSE